MRTLKLLVLAPFAAAIACGGGNSNDNPQVPTVDMSDAGSSMDTNMMDSGSSMSSMTTPSTDMAMDAGAMPSTDTSMSAMDASTADTTMDAGKPAKKGKKKKTTGT